MTALLRLGPSFVEFVAGQLGADVADIVELSMIVSGDGVPFAGVWDVDGFVGHVDFSVVDIGKPSRVREADAAPEPVDTHTLDSASGVVDGAPAGPVEGVVDAPAGSAWWDGAKL